MLFWTGFAMLINAPGYAADFKLIEFGGNYQIKITGPIEPGDNKKLRGVISEKGSFPSGLLVEGNAGDIPESMAVGQFIRKNMLTVTAGETCSNTCFLIWAAGVHRRARGDIDARMQAEDADTVRTYLADIEIPDDIIESALSGEQTILPGAVIKTLELSERHEQWLRKRCGELTQQQELDWQAIQALNSMEDSLNAMGMGGSSMYTVSADTQQQAARAQEMSPQYRDELKQARAENSTCRAEAITEARIN